MLMAPEEGALSLKMLSDHLSHDPIIAAPTGGLGGFAGLARDRPLMIPVDRRI